MKKLQFKGKEFKGSEGEFVVFGVDMVRISTLPHKIIYDATDHDLPYDESKANVKLFANSKKLLEAAINVCQEFDDENDAAEAFKKLEQEILNSL